jgi:heme/copper-type cytochrome/quinol oxidase subunit 2
MTAQVKVVSPAAYSKWAAAQEKQIVDANDQVTQLRQILTSNGNL